MPGNEIDLNVYLTIQLEEDIKEVTLDGSLILVIDRPGRVQG
jgi:hypothetical protein